MKTLTLSAPVQAFWSALLASANSPVTTYYWNPPLPTPPAVPTDPHEAAFYQNVCMDLYNRLQAAIAANPPAFRPAPPPTTLTVAQALAAYSAIYNDPAQGPNSPAGLKAYDVYAGAIWNAAVATGNPTTIYNTPKFQGYAPDGSSIWASQAAIDQSTMAPSGSAP